ncbi:hypothetical protein AAKU67_004046 [Oxalobacteraceae bacterium GrIS 2.11]
MFDDMYENFMPFDLEDASKHEVRRRSVIAIIATIIIVSTSAFLFLNS